MRSLFRHFIENRKANVAIIFALALIPILFLTGMGVDYGLAVSHQVQLNAYADAAALAAVTPTMMANSISTATTAAQNAFNSQASSITGINYSPSNLTVTINTSGSVRTATVAYTATYNTVFPNVLGMSTITIGGTSTATAGLAPNIDFYLLLDDSPSMAIAATQTGINTLISNTQGQCDNAPAGNSSCGCAFGCHETHPQGESYCNASNCNQSGTGNPGGEDNYALARNLGVTLRIDLVRTAAQNLMTTAQTTMTKYNSTYRMGIYTFDVGVNTIQALTSNLTTAQTSAGNIAILQVYQNNYLTSSNNNGDTDTDIDKALSTLNTTMPNPGSGTGKSGDTPQEVLFIVTDGVDDRYASSQPVLNSSYGNYCCSSRQHSTLNPLTPSGSVAGTDWCATIKNRGIRIAVLYTEYLPLPNNGWYNGHVAAFQSNIAGQLQACASPGLYFQVTTGGDISAALANMFQAAVQSAYLSQ